MICLRAADTFSGTAPAGWISAAFTNVTGGVSLTLTSHLAAGEFVLPGDGFYFNLNPADNVQNLLFSLSRIPAGHPAPPSCPWAPMPSSPTATGKWTSR